MRQRARAFISEVIELAATFNAPAIIGSMQGRADNGNSRQQALEHLAESLSELGRQAGQHGQVLLYEPLNRYETNLVNRLEDGARLMRDYQVANVKLLADLFHLSIEEASIPEALRGSASLIGHVHFADSNRRAIGFGHTDIMPIISALREIQFTGYLSAEVLPLPDSQAAAQQTIKSFRTVLH